MALPGMRGIDHIGLTVPDLDEAVGFFTDILGFAEVMEFGPVRDPEGTFMADALDVHPRAEVRRVVMLRGGHGANIELFEYAAPDQKVIAQKNSDVGAFHIGLYVEDIAAAADWLRAKGVRVLAGPIPITEGPNAGQSILYFSAPWGLQFEAISYPDGMAYERGAQIKLWSPRDPAA